MKKALYLFTIISAGTLTGCVSSESEKLVEARTLQTTILAEAHVLDSTLLSETQQMAVTRDLMSTDSLLATDSLFIARYGALKLKLNEMEGLQAEIVAWQNSLTKLPSQDELKKGVKNPFGQKASDQEVFDKIALYRVKLDEFNQRATTLRSSK
ncbi:MAG: hypothetical protein ACK478_08695 [Flavobacteriales bacterium]|jgi:hypothetical protein